MRAQKEQILNEAKSQIITNEPCIIFFNYQGITVKGFEKLRGSIRNVSHSNIKVMKNTLTRKMFEGEMKNELTLKCKGQMALAYSTNDGVAVADAIYNFVEQNKKAFPKIAIRYCLIGNKLYDASMVKELAEYKTINGLKSTFLGLLTQPAQSLLGILEAPASHWIGVLDAKIQQG